MLPATPTQDFLIQCLISEIIILLMQDKKISYPEAFDIFCTSDLIDKLENVETGFYLEGAGYMYEWLKREMKEKEGR